MQDVNKIADVKLLSKLFVAALVQTLELIKYFVRFKNNTVLPVVFLIQYSLKFSKTILSFLSHLF